MGVCHFSSSCPLSDLKSALREETSRGYAPAPSELTGFLLILSRRRRWGSSILFSSSCPLSDLKSAVREESSRGGSRTAPTEITDFLLFSWCT